MLDKVKPAAIGTRRASEFVDDQQVSGPEDNPSQHLQQAIRAQLRGDDTCDACGITVWSSSPVLEICRRLIKGGCDPQRPLWAYRGKTLALIVMSIGQGAQLEIDGHGIGFKQAHERGRGPSVRKSERRAP